VHALRNIHAALVPGGIVVDTQPVSARPTVSAGDVEVGAVDMRQWITTITRLDTRASEAFRVGLYRLALEERFVVADSFTNGRECAEIVRGWRDTRVPVGLGRRLATIETAVEMRQQVRLRLLIASGRTDP
jgi:hypothetical protein